MLGPSTCNKTYTRLINQGSGFNKPYKLYKLFPGKTM